MSQGYFPAAGYYERNADGSQKVDPTTKKPVFHPEEAKYKLVWPAGPTNSAITQAAWLNLATGWAGAHGHLWFIGTANRGTPQAAPHYIADQDFTLVPDACLELPFPPDADQVSILLTTDGDNGVGWAIEVQAK